MPQHSVLLTSAPKMYYLEHTLIYRPLSILQVLKDYLTLSLFRLPSSENRLAIVLEKLCAFLKRHVM